MPEHVRHPRDYIEQKVQTGKLTREDADLILQFTDEIATEAGNTESTVLSNCRYLSLIVENIPGVKEWTNDAINRYVSETRGKYKKNTIRNTFINLRKFSSWLVENNHNTTLNIAKVLKIQYPKPDSTTKTPAMMLSTEEIDKIIESGRNPRDRCLLSILTESGARPSEVLDLKWGDLKIDQYGVIMNASGKKTKTPRYIRLVHSAPYIGAWKNDHPFPNDGSYVFTSFKNPRGDRRITHGALKIILRDAKNRAGTEKRVFPYLMRHCNVTRMLEQGYTDSTIKLVHWGTLKTQMLGTYGHVSNKSIDDETLGKEGVIQTSKRQRKQVHQCPNCQLIVTPTMQYCPKCGQSLTEQARQKTETAMDQLVKVLSTLTPEQKAAILTFKQ